MLGDIRQARNIYIVCGYTDMRKGLNSLVPFVQQNFGIAPYSSSLFLFCDTAKGADASALCFSVMETARRNGLDSFGYLLFLLQELPKLGENPAEEQPTPLLPWAEIIPDYCRLNDLSPVAGALFC